MNPSILAVLGLGFGLACVNGANDVSKGIATLIAALLGIATYTAASMLFGRGAV